MTSLKTNDSTSAQAIVSISLNWLERAMYETSPTPKGCFKQFWTMKLMRSGSRCQLPRGFVKGRKKPLSVGGK